jgi:hypothetical protein
MLEATPFHIVITEAEIRLVRWPGADWQDLQDTFEGYMTSFGPLDEETLWDLLHAEWPDLARLKDAEIRGFFCDGAASLILSV